MRRKSDKEIIKEFRGIIVFGVISILLGVTVLLLPLVPSIPYEEYIEKEIVVSEFDHTWRYRANYVDYIITEDGEKYNITGEYNRTQLKEILVEGTVARIKYDVNEILPYKRYAEEVIVDGAMVVTYDNDKPIDWTPYIILSTIFCLLGVVLIFMSGFFIIQNKKIQAKRDARILKKYGNLKNNAASFL